MATLAARLDQIREAGDAKRNPEWTAIMKQGTADLIASGIADKACGVGDVAPAFARPNLDQKTVRLSALVRRGPVVLSFFRGRW